MSYTDTPCWSCGRMSRELIPQCDCARQAATRQKEKKLQEANDIANWTGNRAERRARKKGKLK
jgi:hypothetical protein